MTSTRIAAIVVGMASLFFMEMWEDVRWYIAVQVSIIIYLVIRCAGWALTERRRLN
jgi:hypothetical protein